MKTTQTLILLALILLSPLPALAIHDKQGDTKCLDCHQAVPFEGEKLAYTDKILPTCRKCHQDFPCDPKESSDGFSHPLEVKPSMAIPPDMPLTGSGRITCITCHSYHAEFWDAESNNESMLRRPRGMKLCHTCHKKFPER